MKFFQHLALAAVLTLASGCSIWNGLFGSKSAEYKSPVRAGQPLEVPPELTAPPVDDRYAVPDPRAQTTFSAYNKERAGAPGTAASATPVLPRIEGVRIERAGDQRWLVVKGAPEAVWPKVKEFWEENGFPLQRDTPEVGIMETEWHEDRNKIPDDIVRRTVGRVLDKLYSTPYRDKFRTRLEKGTEPGTTEVFVSHRGVEEIYTNAQQDHTVWQPRPTDHGMEAEMLTRIAAKLGTPQVAVLPNAPKPGAPGAVAATAAPSNAALDKGTLTVNDSFDRAWRRVGLALDRAGFTVEDRDRSKGLFFVRYIDPEADVQQQPAQKKSFMEKLQFWKSSSKSSQPQYRIHVADAGANRSQVEVQNPQGAAESSSTGRKILTLLFEQLK